MAVQIQTQPIGIERLMPANGLVISKTDPRGVITYGNRLFIGLSGYSESELIGAPHNLIRHPLMPKAAFQDLWSTVQAGDEWHGIVVNLAKDGRHYWVDATVTPSFAGNNIVGFMSVRRFASRAIIEETIPTYRSMVAAEGKPFHGELDKGHEEYTA